MNKIKIKLRVMIKMMKKKEIIGRQNYKKQDLKDSTKKKEKQFHISNNK